MRCYSSAVSDIRFQLDEHMQSAIAVQLRRRGIDILTADEALLRGAADTAYFAYSLETGRVLVSFDRHFAQLHNRQIGHAGVVYFPRGNRSVGEVVEALLLVREVYTADEMLGRLEYL
jgi:predicted nuclease of predicted toxin-antitoxin system